MTTRPIPPHGSEARYRGTRTGRPGCRCNDCVRGQRQAGIARERRLLRGERNMIPRAELLPHIQTLVDSGMSRILIGRYANVAQSTITYLINGRSQACRHDVAARILAVQPSHFDNISERPAIGTIRRVRALYSLGHSRHTIATLTGLSTAGISLLADGRWTVIDGSRAAAVDRAYRQLITTRGTSWKNQRRAAAEGWHGPLAWDAVDDPQATPDVDEYVDRRGRPAEIDAAEVARLTRAGHSTAEIALQLGCHVRTVTRARGRISPQEAAA
ncbi:helix-turn-helix domain-containing protein [Streptomyces sp. NPDC046465]|uniref:helix-turn-helix domain-containing protein n=1 Tax=Streptomyces sp. NPDC046465 TaxID=3155810 RepID=UPI0033CE8BF5